MSDIKIIYEDDDLLAINKPAGLIVHADGRSRNLTTGKTEEPTVADWILEHYPNIRDVGEPWTAPDGTVIFRHGIVHRIDRDTSGVLVICKTSEAFQFLKEKFKSREIEKTYHAFSYGECKAEDGVIDRPIARSRKDFRLWSAQRGARGMERSAVTHYKVLKAGLGATLFELKPKTGRTHQIRVHLKAINFPIICDALYAPKREPMLGFERLALHATKLLFTNKEGKNVEISADFPDDFKNAFNLLSVKP